MGLGAIGVVVRAMAFLGDVTVPLAMIVTGAMLGAERAGAVWNRHVTGVAALRLIAFPAIAMVLLVLARMIGFRPEAATSMTLVIISAMPVAVTCSLVAEKYDGDVSLVSHAIFLSTSALLSGQVRNNQPKTDPHVDNTPTLPKDTRENLTEHPIFISYLCARSIKTYFLLDFTTFTVILSQ